MTLHVTCNIQDVFRNLQGVTENRKRYREVQQWCTVKNHQIHSIFNLKPLN